MNDAILIIGAGAAGLAVAQQLQRRKLDYVVVEKAGVGESWAHHYDRLRLNTLKDVSALPGLPMPADYPPFPSASQTRDYLRRYADYFRLNIREGVQVNCAAWQSDGWHVETSAGEMHGRAMVATTGIWNAPVIPGFEGGERFRGQVLHSSAYRNATPFAGKRVLVVGAGNSGSEIAADLGMNGAIASIAIRSGVAFVPRSSSVLAARYSPTLLRALPRGMAGALYKSVWHDARDAGIPQPDGDPLDAYPVSGIDLPQAIRAGRVTVYPALKSITDTGAEFEDGQAAKFDAILFATGYRPALDFIARDQLLMDEAGRPKLDAQWRSVANPHLYCLGFTYPATEGWLQSIGRFAGEVAESLAGTLS